MNESYVEMKLLVQRVLNANVVIEKRCVAQIDGGLLVLVGFGQDDHPELLDKAIEKLINLRVFADQQGPFPAFCNGRGKRDSGCASIYLVQQYELWTASGFYCRDAT